MQQNSFSLEGFLKMGKIVKLVPFARLQPNHKNWTFSAMNSKYVVEGIKFVAHLLDEL